MSTETKEKKTTKKLNSKSNNSSKNGKFNEIVQKSWPKAKSGMEKGLREAKKLIQQGEKHMTEITDKSKKKMKIMNLNHKRDKICQDLGKMVVTIPREELIKAQSVTKEINEINKIDKEIEILHTLLNKKID